MRFRLPLCSAAVALAAAVAPASANVSETWEGLATQAVFNGVGNVPWVGDVSAYSVTTATWPSGMTPDFAGTRSLRSSNAAADTVNTVLTNISNTFDPVKPTEWSVYFSGNSTDITTSRRADLILLSTSGTASVVEDPNDNFDGYKLTIWDPFATAASNVPPNSHEAASLADTLTLWRVDDSDDRWRVVSSISLTSANLNQGWNLRVRRDPGGLWSFGFANGTIGTPVSLTATATDNVADLSGSTFYSGVGWLGPVTDNDATDFGFDDFLVIPEPASLVLLALSGLVFGCRRPR